MALDVVAPLAAALPCGAGEPEEMVLNLFWVEVSGCELLAARSPHLQFAELNLYVFPEN